jgi:hypothetical protein
MNRKKLLLLFILPTSFWLVVSLACGRPTRIRTLNITEADILNWLLNIEIDDLSSGQRVVADNVEIQDQDIVVYLSYKDTQAEQSSGKIRIHLNNEAGQLSHFTVVDSTTPIAVTDSDANIFGDRIIERVNRVVFTDLKQPRIQEIRWVENGVLLTIDYLPERGD